MSKYIASNYWYRMNSKELHLHPRSRSCPNLHPINRRNRRSAGSLSGRYDRLRYFTLHHRANRISDGLYSCESVGRGLHSSYESDFENYTHRRFLSVCFYSGTVRFCRPFVVRGSAARGGQGCLERNPCRESVASTEVDFDSKRTRKNETEMDSKSFCNANGNDSLVSLPETITSWREIITLF